MPALIVAAVVAGCDDEVNLPGNADGGAPRDGGAASDALAATDGTAAAAIWPENASGMVARNRGGGFGPVSPPGSDCVLGEARYTMTVADRTLLWHVCGGSGSQAPLKFVDGQVILTPDELGTVVQALRQLSYPTRPGCGADKPILTIAITSPAGEIEYADSFYQCRNSGALYVDGMDAVFAALEKLLQKSFP